MYGTPEASRATETCRKTSFGGASDAIELENEEFANRRRIEFRMLRAEARAGYHSGTGRGEGLLFHEARWAIIRVVPPR